VNGSWQFATGWLIADIIPYLTEESNRQIFPFSHRLIISLFRRLTDRIAESSHYLIVEFLPNSETD
jgi:hypothetical protein